MKTGAEFGVICLQGKERQRLPQAPGSRRDSGSRFSSEPPAEANPANSLMFNFWPPEQSKFLLFETAEFVVISYKSPRKLKQCPHWKRIQNNFP